MVMPRVLETICEYFIGADFGQKQDYTAICILELTPTHAPSKHDSRRQTAHAAGGVFFAVGLRSFQTRRASSRPARRRAAIRRAPTEPAANAEPNPDNRSVRFAVGYPGTFVPDDL